MNKIRVNNLFIIYIHIYIYFGTNMTIYDYK